MSKYRNHLPQMDGDFFLTDGGLEKVLVFHNGIKLPHFATFVLMETKEGRAAAELFWPIDRHRAGNRSGLDPGNTHLSDKYRLGPENRLLK